MDVDRLSTEELERHKKEQLCFHFHKTGHIGKNCRNTGNNQKQAESKPQDYKKKFKNNMIRKILAALDEEDKEEGQESNDNNKEDKKKEEKEEKDKQDFQ